MNSFLATYSRRQFQTVAHYWNLDSAKYWNPLKSWSQCEYSIDCCKSRWNHWWRHFNRNLALWSICGRPKNWPRWIHWNCYHSKTSFEQYLCIVSFYKKNLVASDVNYTVLITLFQGRKNAEFIPAIMNCFRSIHLIMVSVLTTDLVFRYWKFLNRFVSNIEHFDFKISKQLIKGQGLFDFTLEWLISHESYDISHMIWIIWNDSYHHKFEIRSKDIKSSAYWNSTLNRQ